jgi:protein-S-isoprenylcysteine O-methyltransferase Ste14
MPPTHTWPAILIGLILLTYWLRVLYMVRRTKRSVGHDAHLVPPEPLGRVLRVVWIPVVVLWVLTPLYAGFFAPTIWPLRELFNVAALDWAALAVAAVAFALTWVCWKNMGKSWRMGIDPNEKTELVFSGPFAHVRHPIYGLSSVLMLATMAAVPSPLMLLVGILHLALLQWEVRREERYLVALHGRAYGDYQARVGRFFPRSLTPYRATGGGDR